MILRPRQIPLLRTIRNTFKAARTENSMFDFRNAWKQKFANALEQPDNVPKETWEEMRGYVMSHTKTLTVDAFILNICRIEKFPEAGISYYKFLESNNYKPSAPTLSTYLQLYDLKNGPLTEAEKEHILSLCRSIIREYPSLNSQLVNVIVKCLCRVDEPDEAVKVIENHKENDDYIRSAYSALTSYYYENGKIDLGYKYLVNAIQGKLGPTEVAYNSYLKYCMRDKERFNERIEELFMLWHKYGTKPAHRVVLEISNACNQAGWSTEPTRISRSTCTVCKQKLINDLTDEEYERLRKITIRRLISSKMYYVTDPKEMKVYMKFIDEKKPFDVIIDGLNLLYSNNAKASVLADTVMYYKKRRKKILVVGRKHMKKIIDRMGIGDLADYFYVHDWSKDDIFLLYAAFSSGNKAIVISNDFMKQHKFAMGDKETDTLLQKWQASHQYKSMTSRLDESGEVHTIVQKNNNCWHLPHVNRDTSGNRTRIEHHDWFCFKLPKDKN